MNRSTFLSSLVGLVLAPFARWRRPKFITLPRDFVPMKLNPEWVDAKYKWDCKVVNGLLVYTDRRCNDDMVEIPQFIPV